MNVRAAAVAEQSMEDLAALKQQFVLACRILLNEGVSEAAFNVSVRLSGGRWMTMPVTSPTLVTVDNLKIAPIDGDAPTHWAAHPAIYRVRPDVNAIVHVHPPYAIAFGVLGEEFRPIHHYGTPFLGKIAIDDSPGQTESPERAAVLAQKLGGGRLLLQRAHGTIAAGKDLKEAVLFTLYFEEACKIYAIARQMGGMPQVLTPRQCEKISGQILKQRSQDKGWDHYVDKLTWRHAKAG
ncbi:MAG: class II aldolase/adducin family protein [Xanthobacteraceae bacterium]